MIVAQDDGKSTPGDSALSLTFAELVRLEPALAALEAEVLAYGRVAAMADRLNRELGRAPAPRCANGPWYHSFKPRLTALVGWGRPGRPAAGELAVLWSAEAYDMAYDALYPMFPPCRGCACLPAGYADAERKGVRS